MKVTYLERTCTACPSQWEGTLEDGRMIYIRYRHGVLQISVSKEPTNDVMDAVGGEMVFVKDIAIENDGYMSDRSMLSWLCCLAELSDDAFTPQELWTPELDKSRYEKEEYDAHSRKIH